MPSVADEIREMEEEPEELELPEAQEAPQQAPAFDWLAWLRSPTGEGPVESYLDHPMNGERSRPVARMLRGATGLLGSLNFALADVFFGLLEWLRSRQAPAPTPPPVE